MAEIKQLTEAEAEALAAMAGEIWHEYFPIIITVEQIDYMLDKFLSPKAIRAQMQDGYRYYWVVRDGRQIGFMAVHPEERELFVSKLYLYREERGKGYANAMFSFLDDLCLELSLPSMYLTVNRGNDSSVAIYKKKGFHIVREEATDIGCGYIMDDYVMRKEVR